MSRIAKKPITIPKGVEISIDAAMVNVKGPKGQLAYQMHQLVSITRTDQVLNIISAAKDNENEKQDQNALEALLGTTRANLNNLIQGVFQGYEKKLLLFGVGYRANMQGNKINLSLGFSHPVILEIPAGITVDVPVPTEIIIKGADKQAVGQVAANIRAIRPVELYKGKGVRYSDERVVLKETKKK